MLNSFTFLILDTIYFISHTFYSHFYCQSQYIHFILFYFISRSHIKANF